ncbi:MAG TPA: DedA family protein [Ktedonobacterales bacterium]|nr:DedA family protein [Ktedonobacterales bacterium]
MHIILELVATYGYVVVLLVVMAESAGLPLPGETSLLVAGALAATGSLWLPGVIIAAAAGAILGDTAGYWIGRTSGLRLLRRHGHLLRFDERKLEQAERFFARHGEKAVFLGRFVPIGRIFSAVLAGVSRMRYNRFLFWNATGGIVWATLMGTLGYLFGRQLPLLERLVGQFGFGLLAALLLFIAARIAWSRREQLAAWWAQMRSQPRNLGALRQFFSPRYRWLFASIGIGLATLGSAALALALFTDVM